jgi:DNA polymerase-3 subunit delta'
VKDPHPRVIVIDDADAMSLEAQNALLKLLEEPTPHVHFILTSHSPQLLLATIHSRVQNIELRPVDSDENSKFLESLRIVDETRKRQIAFIAEGRPAEMVRLATDDEYFTSKSSKATDARTFLGAQTYDRLLMASKYSAREEALEFLDMLGRFAIHTLYRQPDSATARRLDAIALCIERIAANGNVKTQLIRLVSKWA